MMKQYIKHRSSSVSIARMDKAAVVRRMLQDGMTQSQVARYFGVSRQNINQLLQRHKFTARHKLAYAIEHGHITKPETCQECGIVTNVQGHHKATIP